MSEFKNFKTPDNRDQDIVIVLTSGGGVRIGKEWTPVVDGLWSHAYAAGAISEDMNKENKISETKRLKEELKLKQEAERELLVSTLKEMYLNPQGNVDKAGKIIMRKLIARLGYVVPTDLVEAVWQTIVDENKPE